VVAGALAWVRRTLSRLGPFLKRAWGRCLLFLEIIGLLPERRPDSSAHLATFKLYHAEFRKLLSANNSFLETIAELEHKLLSGEFVDRPYIERKVVRALADVHSMVESLAVISGNRYSGLRSAFDRASGRIATVLGDTGASSRVGLVMDMEALHARDGDVAGSKMANLGEIRNVMGLPTPEGFVVTTEGFRLLVEEGGIRSMVQQMHAELAGPDDVERVSRALRELIRTVRIPEPLQKELAGACGRLRAKTGEGRRLAVRSSAIGEDSERSFAGQFLTLLDLRPEGVAGAYLEVVASLFCAEAIHYRMLHGIPGESAEMAVGVLAMVDALASGVMFSRDPNEPDSETVVIQALQGVGASIAEGSAVPETISVRPGGGVVDRGRVDSRRASPATSSRDEHSDEGSPDPAGTPPLSVSDEEARLLAQWARMLERHFNGPQDIEWALSRERKLVLLQSRPLRLVRPWARSVQPVPGYRVLLHAGETACPGVGSGRAVHMDEDGDPESFPPGGVLIAKRSSPKFVKVMAKARAIVTDAGSTTGHMASLARELGIPTLLATRAATAQIPHGAVVTVDAGSCFVYEGEVPVPALVPDREGTPEPAALQGRRRAGSSGFELLEKVLEQMAPLNLTNPRDPGFRIDRCQTLHDLSRYIHEKSYEEMFRMGSALGDLRGWSYRLDVFLPIDLYIVDLGGGILKGAVKGRKVKPSQIASVPLSAFVKGMLHEKIPRFGPRPIDARGLLSVMMRHALRDPLQEPTFRDPCYALVSDFYMNYTGRVGYHFSVVDAYCCSTPNKNYISVLFRGGAADRVRRGRRARAIAAIVRNYGFSAEVTHDVVSARISKTTMEETRDRIEMIGRLFQFFRQMDAAMSTEDSVEIFTQAFLDGDYSLECLSASRGGKKAARGDGGGIDAS